MTMRPDAVRRIRELAAKHGLLVSTADVRHKFGMTVPKRNSDQSEEELALLSQLLRRDIVTFDEAAEFITGRRPDQF